MKERLTGAIILVALIVLLVPELLTGPIRSNAALRAGAQAAAPSAEEPPLRSYTIDLADDSRPHARTTSASSGSADPTQPSGPAQPEPITAATTQESPAGAQSSSSASGSQEGSAQASAPTTGGQQSGAGEGSPASSFGPDNSQPHSQQGAVPEHGSAAMIDTPTAGKPAAESSAKPSPQAPPSGAKPTAASGKPSAGSGAWMVQLGVFANRANADRLTQELKGKGFHASVSESAGGGRRLYRVRAGPISDHAAAEQLASRLRAAGHPGAIVPRS